MVAGAVSLRKSHDIVILSFCNKVKGQAKYIHWIDVLGFEKSKIRYNIFVESTIINCIL